MKIETALLITHLLFFLAGIFFGIKINIYKYLFNKKSALHKGGKR